MHNKIYKRGCMRWRTSLNTLPPTIPVEQSFC